MKHSDVVGGSTAGQLLGCPGSVALCKQVPKQRESEYMAEGSMLHDVIEALVNEPTTDPTSMIGYRSFGVTLTSEHVHEAIIPALAEVSRVMELYDIDIFDTEVEASWESEIPGAFGSIDLIGLGKVNLIWDWKFGRGYAVHATENSQLMFYAAGAMLSAGLDDIFDPELPTVLAICQPRISVMASLYQVSTAELQEFIARLKSAVQQSQSPDAKLAVGEHCKWCNAKPVCPLKRETAHRIKDDIKDDMGDLGELLPLAEEMAEWAKSVRAAALSALKDGGEVKGYKLVAKRGNRMWAETRQTAKLLRNRGFRVADTHEKVLRSPAQIEKLAKRLSKKLDMGVLGITQSSGVVVAPATDPRAAVAPAGDIRKLGEKYAGSN